jgi:uncharacterized protein YgiM (DUF1202 family)
MRLARYLAMAIVAVSLTLSGLLLATVFGTVPRSPDVSAQEITVGVLATVNVDSLVVRAEPGLDGAQVASITFGESVLVVDGPVDADGYEWFLLEQDGDRLGWSVQGFAQDPDAASTGGTTGTGAIPAAQTIWTVTTPFLLIRSAASETAPIQRIVTAGTRLTQTGEGVDTAGARWFPVEGNGWIGGAGGGPSAGVTLALYPLYVSADVLNVRSTPSMDGDVVQTLELGDAVNVFGSIRDSEGNDWNAVDEDGSLWVAAEWLTISLPDDTTDATPTAGRNAQPVG